jgi:hypothetical protein
MAISPPIFKLEVKMPSTPIYRRHDPASQTKFQEVKQLARSQERILAGTPGTLKQRTQSGKQYWVREYRRVDGKKTDEYIGPASTVDKETITRLSSEIDLAKALASSSGHLRLLGFQRVDRKPAAVLEVLYNKGLFNGGLTLVGSHAYGILLNELGILAPGYTTEDIDLARTSALALALPVTTNFQSLLKETGLPFVPVPGMPSRRPSASFKLPGSERLAVDLLVPGKGVGEIIPVKELDAYAQAIPLLDFLIADPIHSVALSPNQVIPVLIPSPERFALHKLFSSQSRTSGNRDKIRKDLQQAAVLAAALEEEMPTRLKEAFRDLPNTGKSQVKKGSVAASKLLQRHEHAKEALLAISER